MRTAVIIQARIGSSRLPGKVLLPLPTGRSVLAQVISQAKKIRGVDAVVVAIPSTRLDDVLVQHVHESGVELYRGPHLDVLARYWQAAQAVKADVIMRITADCPMISPVVCSEMLAEYRESEEKWDFLSNTLPRTYPKGFDCEIFAWGLLDAAHKMAHLDYEREHVTAWMHSGWYRTQIKIGNHRNEDGADHSEINFCIDTIEDYARMVGEFNRENMRRQARLTAAGSA